VEPRTSARPSRRAPTIGSHSRNNATSSSAPEGSVSTARRSSVDAERRVEPPRREGRRLPASELSDEQRREFHEALLDADRFEDLPGKWQAAILQAEDNRPRLRVVT
jgi:hypothetical protein